MTRADSSPPSPVRTCFALALLLLPLLVSNEPALAGPTAPPAPPHAAFDPGGAVELYPEILVALFTEGLPPSSPGAVTGLRFALELRDPIDADVAFVTSDDPAFHVDAAVLPGGAVRLVFALAGTVDDPGLSLHVVVTVVPIGTPAERAELHFSARVVSGRRSIAAIRFPLVDVVAAPDDDLAWPYGTGVLLEDVVQHPLVHSESFDLAARHPGEASMQWACLQPEVADTRPSFFLSTQDSKGVDKEYDVAAGESEVRLSIRHVPSDPHSRSEYDAPFRTVVGYVAGDWYGAARLYRQWALEQPWTAQGPMRDDPTFPDAIRDMALFGTFGPDPDVLDWRPWPARHHEQVVFFGTANLVPQLYGWYGHQHDTVWGSWKPDPAFLDAAGPVAAADGAFSPYTLLHEITIGHEPPVPGYDPTRLIDFAVVGEDGEATHLLDAAGNESFEVCQSTAFARDYAAWLATRLKMLGAAGMYLDVFNALPPQRCHATHHGHPPVDPEGTHRRLEVIDAIGAAVGARFYVSSESVQEMFLGRVDIGLSQWTRNVLGTAVTHVPLFEAVYGDFLRVGRVGVALNFENDELPPSPFHALARQTLAAHVSVGRAPFTGALLNGDSLLDNAAASASYARFLDLARSTVGLLVQPVVHEHVVLGERLRDPHREVAAIDFAPLGENLALLDLPGGLVQPAVYVSAFARPDEDSILVLLQNWTEPGDADRTGLAMTGGPQEVAWTLPPSFTDPEHARLTITRLLADGRTLELGQVDASEPIHWRGTIPARTSEAFLLSPTPPSTD